MNNTDKSIINESSQATWVSTNVIVGIFTALGLIFYFVIMRLFNLHKITELHYVNILVLFLGLWFVIKRKVKIKGEIKYFEGLKSGIVVTLVSLIIFNVFMFVYATIIDPPFLEFLKENIQLSNGLTSQQTMLNVMGILTIEGLSSGFIMTFILMQYYKADSSETK